MTIYKDLLSLVDILPEEQRPSIEPKEDANKLQRWVYCEIDFLKKIKKQLERPINVMNMSQLDWQLKTFFDVLVDFDLCIDVPDEHLRSLQNVESLDSQNNTDNIIRKIIARKKSSNRSVKLYGLSHFKKISELKDSMDNLAVNALYFSCENSNLCKKTADDWGVMIIQYDEKKDFLSPIKWLNQSTLDVQVEKFSPSNKWALLNAIAPKSNSLVLVDGYSIQKKEAIELNIIPILDRMLPKSSLNIPYEITIIANKPKADDNNALSIQESIELINNRLLTIRPQNFSYKLNVCDMGGLEHNRWLITNNQYIKCEGGFDLITYRKNNGKIEKVYSKSTGIHVSNIYTNPTDRKDYESLCKRIWAMKYNCTWYDNTENRLLC